MYNVRKTTFSLLISIPIILALVVLPVFASSISSSSIKVTPVKDAISPFDAAEFKFSLTNNKNFDDTYRIYGTDVDWSISTTPVTDFTAGLDVSANSTKGTTLFLKPSSNVQLGKNNVVILFKSQNNPDDILEEVVNVDVRKDLIVYPSDLTIDMSAPSVMSPLTSNSVKVHLKNNNEKELGTYTIRLVSPLFQKETSIELGPSAEKVIDFTVALEGNISPRTEEMSLIIIKDGITIKEFTKKFEVAGYEDISEQTMSTSSFLKTVVTHRYTHNGTVTSLQKVVIEKTRFESYFTKTSPALSKEVRDGKITYIGTIEIKPGETVEVVVSTNYRPLFYAAILILLLLVLYYAVKEPLVLSKQVKNVEVTEGGLKRLHVILRIKNRGGRVLRELKIYDRIPPICLFKKIHKGTLKPTKTYPYQGGHAIMYEIHHLDPGEEVLLDYEIETKLTVVGDFKLKPFIVQYDGRKKTRSNSVDVYTP